MGDNRNIVQKVNDSLGAAMTLVGRIYVDNMKEKVNFPMQCISHKRSFYVEDSDA